MRPCHAPLALLSSLPICDPLLMLVIAVVCSSVHLSVRPSARPLPSSLAFPARSPRYLIRAGERERREREREGRGEKTRAPLKYLNVFIVPFCGGGDNCSQSLISGERGEQRPCNRKRTTLMELGYHSRISMKSLVEEEED